jgi:VIT1/CCC1 family predicted Fe2+/Mn2+ transporter
VGFFLAKGLAEQDARFMADRLMTNKAAVLDTMAREELGIDPKELGGSAWVAASSSFALFVLGAIVPVLPFFFATGQTAIAVSMGASAIGLLVLGGAIGWLNGLQLWYAAGRQLVFGLVAGAITYGLGRLMGVAIQ